MKLLRASNLTIGAVALVLASCGQQNRYVAPPPPKVAAAPPVQRQVTRYLEFTGTTAAVNTADLVARVPGFVQEIDYQDGAAVKAATLLFTIEPEPYDVKLKQAQASVLGAQASLNQAQTDFNRSSALVATQATSRQQYDQAVANRDVAQSNLAQAQANVELAQLNSDYAHVKAPFDGTVTARQVSIGDFVGGSATSTVLATIVQFDPIYVNFNISENDVQRLRVEIARRGLTSADLNKVPVEVGLQTETGYPHSGLLNYRAPTVDTSTGTLAARAIFKNSNFALLPGYFVRGRIPIGVQQNALLVPDAALGTDQSGRYLLVVDKDGVVQQRSVTIGSLDDGLRVIETGLNPDDRVVTAGVQRAVPGQKVDVQPPDGATSATPH
jgi:RND family efflux transporter MFP subunit